ncbi:MAG: tripartite tricarboxylate transporter permease [Candidatus Bathyarchaeia archaeon]
MAIEIINWLIALLQPIVFISFLLGFLIGLIFGIIPGLTATLAIALLLPFTFGMETVQALATCVAIYASGIYGGGITGTLINIPGTPGGAITTLEGYKLTLRGKAAKALTHGAFSSMIGGVLGTILAIILLEPIARASLVFQTHDKFSLVLMAIVVVSVLNTESIVKGIISTALGLMLATIGIDPLLPIPRFTFGVHSLTEGISLIAAVVGMFAVSEVLRQIEVGLDLSELAKRGHQKISRKELVPKREDFGKIGLKIYPKSALIGFFVGVLPGAGAAMAALLSYAEAKRSSKHKEEFGEGSLEGIVAAETANNAMCPGAIIPMLTFGIPGDSVTAVMLGVLLIHGLIPSPYIMFEKGNVVGPMLVGLIISSIMCYVSLLILGPLYAKILNLKGTVLYPFIAMIAFVGVYTATFSIPQLWMALFIGVATYLLSKADYPSVPFLMGYILGPMFENYLRTSLSISKGNPLIFLTSPLSAIFLLLAVIFAYFLGVRLSRVMKSIQ